MVKKPVSDRPQPANLSADQTRAGIPQLERRIKELSSLDLTTLNEENGDDVLNDHVRKIEATLVRVFGHNTIEYHKFRVDTLSAFPRGIIPLYGDDSFRARLHYIKTDVSAAISRLQSAIDILTESLEVAAETPEAKTLRAYGDLQLHPEVARAATRLFTDGHYANAVEAAVKALNGLVRLRSELEIDGTTLMEKAFSPNAPILAFNGLANQSDKDEQRGFMMMFSGAVAGLRNPRAHGFINDDPERALEFIAFVSLLAKLLDSATRK
jgi:uncharacterized protein (TIGR02391 family)